MVAEPPKGLLGIHTLVLGPIRVTSTILQKLGVEGDFLGQVREDIEAFTLSVLGHSLGLWSREASLCVPRKLKVPHMICAEQRPGNLLPQTLRICGCLPWNHSSPPRHAGTSPSPLSRFGSKLTFSVKPSLITVFKIESLFLTWPFPPPSLLCFSHNPGRHL